MKCPIQDKVKIDYPCKWGYRIITTHDINIDEVIFNLNWDMKYTITKSNENTKFVSYSIRLEVNSDEQRVGIYQQLKDIKSIKYVL